jgi:hypothetical protein
MAQYLYKFRGRGISPADAQLFLSEQEHLNLISASDNSLLVSGTIAELKSFGEELGGWFFTPVKSVPRPLIGANRQGRIHRP